ncbi:MAG TPA: disulfide oxidoreductase [Bacillota bacterium]|nr:disulfide oxidoreductase [Bacillota bacterium]
MGKEKMSETLLIVIWTLSLVATAGSLFYSEVMGYIPCELCWVQRIFMYPLVVIYGVAAYKRNVAMALPGLFLSGIGMCISIWHYLLQKWPALQSTGEACGPIPCNTEYINYFGFVTIPFLAGVAFIIICILHVMLWRKTRRNHV